MHLKHYQEVQQYLNDMIKAILDFFDRLLNIIQNQNHHLFSGNKNHKD